MLLLALWVPLTLLYVTLGERVKGSHGQYWFSWIVAEDWTSDLPESLLLLITLSLLPSSVLIMISCSGCLTVEIHTFSKHTINSHRCGHPCFWIRDFYIILFVGWTHSLCWMNSMSHSPQTGKELLSTSSVWMLKFLTIVWSINKINDPDFWYITSGWLRNGKSYLSVGSFSPLLLSTYLMEALTV